MLTWAFFRCIDAALLDGFEVWPSNLAHPLFWGSVGLGLAGQVWLHWSDGSGKSCFNFFLLWFRLERPRCLTRARGTK